VIEEEIYSDSGKSSVYTDEDSFGEDENLTTRFVQKFPLFCPGVDEDGREAAPISESSGDTVKPETEKSKVSWPSYMAMHAEKMRVKNTGNPHAKHSAGQKQYVNKQLPKHYIERLKDKRVDRFLEYESQDAAAILAKKNRRMKRRLQRKLAEEKTKEKQEKLHKALAMVEENS
jgi:hypothetical protein